MTNLYARGCKQIFYFGESVVLEYKLQDYIFYLLTISYSYSWETSILDMP